jgi:hypothetical protein
MVAFIKAPIFKNLKRLASGVALLQHRAQHRDFSVDILRRQPIDDLISRHDVAVSGAIVFSWHVVYDFLHASDAVTFIF